MLVRNLRTGEILGSRVGKADSFGRRLRGLMFRSGLGQGEGLLIEPCKSVHTHFMRFPIDVLFLDRERRVVHFIPAMAPWKTSPLIKGAHAVLEVTAGAAEGTTVGDRLEFCR